MIGERLRQVRIKLGYKEQKDFANIFPKEEKITPLKISRLENETNKMTSEFLSIMNKNFNVNINWLLTGQGEMFMDKNKINSNSQNSNNLLLIEVDNFTKNMVDDFKMLNNKNQKAIHFEILAKLKEEEKI